MDDNGIKKAISLAKLQVVKYNRLTKVHEEEAINMTQFVEKINNVNVSPKHLRELGLLSDWKERVPPRFVEKVVRAAERYKRDLRELSKR